MLSTNRLPQLAVVAPNRVLKARETYCYYDVGDDEDDLAKFPQAIQDAEPHCPALLSCTVLSCWDR